MDHGRYIGARTFGIGGIIYTVTVYQISEGYTVAWNCARCRELTRLTAVATDLTAAIDTGHAAANQHHAEAHSLIQAATV